MRFAVENHCRTLKAEAELQIKHKDKRRFKTISENLIFFNILTLIRHSIKYLEKYVKTNLFFYRKTP